MTLYYVKDWQLLYETNETRKLKALSWWPKPNKHDGLGFRRMVRERDKVQLFCAWNLICDIASKTTPQDRRGYLERDSKPLNAEDMSVMTDFPSDIFTRALDFFGSTSVGWLCMESAGTPGESAGVPGKSPAVLKEGKDQKESMELVAAIAATSEHSAFIKGWSENYLACHKVKYQFEEGRDGKAVKELLKMGILRIDLLEIAKKAWAWKGNAYLQSRSLTIHGFRQHFNEINSGITNGNNRQTNKQNPRNLNSNAGAASDYEGVGKTS